MWHQPLRKQSQHQTMPRIPWVAGSLEVPLKTSTSDKFRQANHRPAEGWFYVVCELRMFSMFLKGWKQNKTKCVTESTCAPPKA